MRRIIAALAALMVTPLTCRPAAAQCTFPPTSHGREITYTLTVEPGSDGTVLHVQLAFAGMSSGHERLYIPAQWAGESLHSLTNLHPVSPGLTIDDDHSPASRVANYPPGREVVLAYDLRKDWTGRFIAPLQFHPVLMPDYLEFTANNALVFPIVDLTDPVTVRFDWRQLPATWVLATSFGTTTSPDPAGRCQSFSGAWTDAQHALFTAGVFRVRSFNIGPRQAVLAIRGDWTFTDEEAIAAIQKTVGVVRDFWQDDGFPYFLVTMKAYDQDRGSSDGSAFTNAFWMYMSRQDPLTAQLTTLAHESFHAWNPHKMGTIAGADDKETQWFAEGFTRYYADLLLYRAGILSLATYLDDTNRDLADFPSSTSPYVRGRVIALWLDARVRESSQGTHSLDDVMRDMVRDGNTPITRARILATAARYLPADDRAVLDAATGAGRGPLTAPNRVPVVSECARLSMDALSTFDLGFDFAASRAAGHMIGVVNDGPAFKAGLRDGQELRGFSIYNGHADRAATIRIHTDAGDQAVTYLPAGPSVLVPQYHAQPGQGCGVK